MATTKFKPGDLVRKCSLAGTPYGPWLKVTLANTRFVHAKPAEPVAHPERMEQTLKREHVWKPKIARLCVSVACIEGIKNGKKIISHPHSPNWVKTHKVTPDIVMFYAQDGIHKVYCTLEYTKLLTSLGGPTVWVFIDRIVCC